MCMAQPSAAPRERPQQIHAAGCSSLDDQSTEDEAAAVPLPRILEELWHYQCVVSLPHSPPPTNWTPPPAPDGSPDTALLSASSSSSCSPLAALLPDDMVAQSSIPQAHRSHDLLGRVFTTFDENRDGRVSTHEIVRIFEKLGLQSGSIDSLLAGIATKCDGHMDEQEFCLLYDTLFCGSGGGDFNPTSIVAPAATSASSSAPAAASCVQTDIEPDLLAAFHVFDKDGNGLISPSELQSVLCALGFPQARELETCVDMIARVDHDGDGHVDFAEFKNMFHV